MGWIAKALSRWGSECIFPSSRDASAVEYVSFQQKVRLAFCNGNLPMPRGGRTGKKMGTSLNALQVR